MTEVPPNKLLVALTDKEMRRLHSLLAPILVSDGYRSDSKAIDNPCSAWAREQLTKFHNAIIAGKVVVRTAEVTE